MRATVRPEPAADTESTLVVADIKTNLGNDVLEQLVRAGWVVEHEYPLTAFDKGIDHDAYTLVRNGERLEFEWSNWDEWQISGPRAVVRRICIDFGIRVDA